jgi:dTDP-4-dehydrorhamnose reductase
MLYRITIEKEQIDCADMQHPRKSWYEIYRQVVDGLRVEKLVADINYSPEFSDRARKITDEILDMKNDERT